MSYKERLEKMLSNGVITAEQAKNLQENILKVAPSVKKPAHRKLPTGMIAGGVGIVVVFLLTILLFSGANSEQSAQVVQDVSESLNQAGATGGVRGSLSTFMALVILGLPLIAAFIGYMPFIHNRFVSLEEEMLASWAHVESSYQKRADLLPNLAEAVRRYMGLEQNVQNEVTQARAEAGDLAEALENLGTARGQDMYEAADLAAMAVQDKAVGKLFAVMENYPDLKASENVTLLQKQLEDIESQINAARIYYNDATRDYNRAIGKMPGNLVAAMGGFRGRPHFESTVAASTAGQIELNVS